MRELERLGVSEAKLAEIASRFGVLELSLFGSVLRDDFRADSDIDVLVEFVPGCAVSLFTLLRTQHQLEDLLGRRVDLIPKNDLKSAVRARVPSSALLVYSA